MASSDLLTNPLIEKQTVYRDCRVSVVPGSGITLVIAEFGKERMIFHCDTVAVRCVPSLNPEMTKPTKEGS